MLDSVKERLASKAKGLLESPAVAGLLESELASKALEAALSAPLKVSGALQRHRERVAALLDLATQQDVDDLRRALRRTEEILRHIRDESGELLEQTEDAGQERSTIAK